MDNPNWLDRVRIVLVRPTHPGNIGAVARAMGNMGLSDLVLVAPREFPSAVATARASGADHILTSARVVADLDRGIHDCRYVIGTTARMRSIAWPSLAPREAAALVAARLEQEDQAGAVRADECIALLFGPERSGLSNTDVDRCHALVHIPVDTAMPSLNLASAVLVMAYELRVRALDRRTATTARLSDDRPDGGERVDPLLEITPNLPHLTQGRVTPLASSSQLQGFYAHLQRVLDRIDFLKAKPPVKLMRKIVRIFNRTQLSAEEINILRGILTTVEHRLDERDDRNR